MRTKRCPECGAWWSACKCPPPKLPARLLAWFIQFLKDQDEGARRWDGIKFP